jgi:predicted GTPase
MATILTICGKTGAGKYSFCNTFHNKSSAGFVADLTKIGKIQEAQAMGET